MSTTGFGRYTRLRCSQIPSQTDLFGCLKESTRKFRLPDDAGEGASLHGIVKRNGDRERSSVSSRMRQISSPERTRSLPNRNLHLGYEDLPVKSPGHFGRFGGLEEQRRPRPGSPARLNGGALARNIEFRTKRNEAVVFSFDDRRQARGLRHNPSLWQIRSS